MTRNRVAAGPMGGTEWVLLLFCLVHVPCQGRQANAPSHIQQRNWAGRVRPNVTPSAVSPQAAHPALPIK